MKPLYKAKIGDRVICPEKYYEEVAENEKGTIITSEPRFSKYIHIIWGNGHHEHYNSMNTKIKILENNFFEEKLKEQMKKVRILLDQL